MEASRRLCLLGNPDPATGPFLGSGKTLATGGPAFLVGSYVLVSVMTYLDAGVACRDLGLPPASRWDRELLRRTLPVNDAAWISIMVVAVVWLSVLPVNFYGESESWFASLKVITIICLLMLSSILFWGGSPSHGKLGLRYWQNPGASSCLVSGASNAAASLWVVGIRNAGVPVLNHIVNAVIATAAWSSGNSPLYLSSRSLYSTALHGAAPRTFAKRTSSGVPSMPLVRALLKTRSKLQLVGSWISLWSVLSSDFLSAYIGLPSFAIIHLVHRTSHMVDLDGGMAELEAEELCQPEPVSSWASSRGIMAMVRA
ncbi:uncharacterized protein GMORB2_0367 [Geosmithia morbida]|uniref:Amino acid permease/ SLC12A domain-containing protein n=1 Tax=Geosmithia morbida TaxID=1094350 RepID=A0A9P5D7H1_9HYPO|nr:uncharacterized protein GMORB2_0367 [Geosmithia morbida]KAF4126631.1 uncharacterized protein GMORB2_0367 [Geosmithia morbida]